MGIEHLRVPADRLAPAFDPDELGFDTTEEVESLEGTIGQDRAISALELGLDIEAPGFNLFISGAAGTGRNTAVRAHLEQIASTKPVPDEWGYVYNFQDPTQPLAIELPCGMMRDLASDMTGLVDSCRREIPGVFESDDYTHRVEEVMADIQAQRQTLTDELEREAQAQGFTLSFAQASITPVPLGPEGRPFTQEEFGALTEDARDELRERAEGIQHSITHAMREIRRLSKEAVDRAKEVDTELLRFTLKPIIDELQEKYAAHDHVVTYLDRVEADIVQHVEIFKSTEASQAGPPGLAVASAQEDIFTRYRVNRLVDNSACVGAPVVFEHSPTYYNLFGRVDYRARVGTLTTDHTMIKAGALHSANGGYLVVQARDLLLSPLSWDTLKRTLRSGEVRIENIGEQYSALPSDSLRPQPVPVNAKVIMAGAPDVLTDAPDDGRGLPAVLQGHRGLRHRDGTHAREPVEIRIVYRGPGASGRAAPFRQGSRRHHCHPLEQARRRPGEADDSVHADLGDHHRGKLLGQ